MKTEERLQQAAAGRRAGEEDEEDEPCPRKQLFRFTKVVAVASIIIHFAHLIHATSGCIWESRLYLQVQGGSVVLIVGDFYFVLDVPLPVHKGGCSGRAKPGFRTVAVEILKLLFTIHLVVEFHTALF